MKSKGQLHKKIDSIEDEEDDLTDEQWEELEEAIQQIKDGKTISWTEFLDSTKQWRHNNYVKKSIKR